VPLKSGLNKDRRTIYIADESGVKISVTMWGSLSNLMNYEIGQVLAIKNAKVSDYGGKSLNCGDDTSAIYLNPSHPRTNQLLNWHSHGGVTQNL